MCEVVQVSQDTQKKSAKAVALLTSRESPVVGTARGSSPAGWEGEAHLGRNSHWE